MSKILLSFDVEEFDLPLEYGLPIDSQEQLMTGYKGLQQLHEVLQEKDLRTTLFTTAFFAEHFPADIRALSNKHEIASHTYYHTAFTPGDLLLSKQRLETITGRPIHGLRMPRMKQIDAGYIRKAGYQYNSSLNPAWIPGRYNNLHMPRTLFHEKGLLQFPVSVTSHLRIPLFWLAFKNMPYPLYLNLVLRTLRRDGYVSLYFHPWEFTDLTQYRLPGYIRKGSTGELLVKLKRLVRDLSGEGEFTGMYDYLKKNI